MRSIPCTFCVTDSTAAAGMPDGDYRLGSHTVTKCMGGVRLPDGTLAGSTLTMDQALRNLVEVLGLPLREASERVSTHAASYLGLADRGRLVPGAMADVVVFDPETVGTTALERLHDLPTGADRLVARSRGIEHIFVAGQAIRRSGRDLAAGGAGRVLRPVKA